MKIGLFHGSKLDQIYLFSINKSWKRGDFENPKVINRNFSTILVPDKYGFCNSTVPGGTKTVVSGESL